MVRDRRLVVGGLDEFVDQVRGGGVADPVAGLGDGGADADEQVRLAGAGVADEAQRLPGSDPGAVGEGVDERGVDERVGVEVEVLEAFGAGEAGLADQAGLAAFLAFVALGGEQVDEEAFVAGLLACARRRRCRA